MNGMNAIKGGAVTSYAIPTGFSAAKTGSPFLDAVAEQTQQKERLITALMGSTMSCNTLSNEEKQAMSMEEYQEYFKKTLSELVAQSSFSETDISFHISDEAFERMKRDSYYEKQILGLISRDLTGCYPFHSPSSLVFEIGGTLDDYKVTSSPVETIHRTEKEKSFWEQRVQRHKDMMEEQAKVAKKKHLEDKLVEEKDKMAAIIEAQIMAARLRGDNPDYIGDERIHYSRGVPASLILSSLL